MPENVCCPNCWSWSEAGARTTCKRCGSPLLLPDGRRMDAARSDPPPPPPPPAAFGYAPSPAMPYRSGYGGPGLAVSSGTDWVAICRWITIGYGLLVTLALIAVGVLIQHITVPITDPSTGLTTQQTFDIGPAFAVVAVIFAGFMGLFAWLTQFTAARILFLLLDVLALLSLFSGASASARAGGFGLVELFTVAVDVVYGGALVMSLFARPQRVYG